MRKSIRIFTAFTALALCCSLSAPFALAWEQKGDFREGMALATDGSKWGYTNPAGTLAIPLRFDEASPFSLGTAIVKERGKYGLLRQDGLWLLEPIYDTLTPVDYGVYIGVKSGVPAVLTAVSNAGKDWLNVPVAAASSGKDEAGVWKLTVELVGGEKKEIVVNDLPAALRDALVPGAAFSLRNGASGDFSDVNGKDWFSLWVNLAANTALMEGPGDGKFWPYRTVTVGEALKLAAALDARATGKPFLNRGNPWYTAAVDYCVKADFITDKTFDSYTRPITRAELALVFAGTTPAKDAAALNDASRVRSSIPDVAPTDFAASAIYALYAKGITNGSDKLLTFRPDTVITRSEVAAIVSRLARPEQRLLLWPVSAAAKS